VFSYPVNYESVKNWKNITISLPGYDIKEILDQITTLDIISVSVENIKKNNESEWFDHHDEPLKMHGDTHDIKLLVNENQSSRHIVQKFTEILNLDKIPIFKEETLPDQDWLQKTQTKFNIINISNKLRIVPPWKKVKEYNGLNIIINPGSGFGTGSHPTTRLCLRWIEENDIKNKSLIDYGSGSGILAIAATLYGAKMVMGAEIDEKAIKNAVQNCRFNNLDVPFMNLNKTIINEKFDILIANILSKTLIQLKPTFKSLATKKIILCGLLDRQVSTIIDTYSDFVNLKLKYNLKGWNLLEGEL
tara:strand:+ start:3037 stop:3948 length:912 start_codon:yes stop_codon:yes gene_type:complete